VESSDKAGEARKAMRPYRCFLVRCHLEEGVGPNREPCWRFTVQQAAPDTLRHAFTSLRDVAAYLEAELAFYDVSAQAPDKASVRS
jgi:hypothetical protein